MAGGSIKSKTHPGRAIFSLLWDSELNLQGAHKTHRSISHHVHQVFWYAARVLQLDGPEPLITPLAPRAE